MQCVCRKLVCVCVCSASTAGLIISHKVEAPLQLVFIVIHFKPPLVAHYYNLNLLVVICLDK